jgi:hypothetical protein
VSANNNPDRSQFLTLKLEIYIDVQELAENRRQIKDFFREKIEGVI